MAITFDAASSADGTSNPFSWSHTVGAGDHRMLVVGVSIRKESNPRPVVSSVTYDGEALTQAVTEANDGKTSADIWYMVNPPVGTATVEVATDTAPTNIVGGAASWFGIDTFYTVTRVGGDAGESSSISVDLLVESGYLAISVASSVSSITVAGDQTQRWTDSNSFLHGRGGSQIGTGGTESLAWTMGGTQKWTIAAAVFKPYVPQPPAFTQVTDGALKLVPELWTATVDNVMVEDITDLLIEARIEMNVDRQISGAATIKIRNPERVSPYVQYLAPFVTYTREDGSAPERRQLGLYDVRIPQGEYTTVRSEATFVGEDVTSLLAQTVLTDTWNIAATTNVREAMIDLIEHAGVSRYILPPSSVTLAAAMSFQTGTLVINAVNQLCSMLGWYHVSGDLQGNVTSAGDIRDASTMEPLATWTQDDMRSPTFAVNPSALQVVNVVVCVNTNNAQAPLTSVARNDDPTSPTSTVTLGREISYPGGPIQVAGEVSQARLDQTARRYLREGRSFYRTGVFAVLPTPDALLPQQVVDLDLSGSMEPFSGRWFIRTATIGMTPATAITMLETYQTTLFDGSPV